MASIPEGVQRAKELAKAKALNVWRDSWQPEAQAATDHLLGEMRSAGIEMRRNAYKLEKTVQAVILDLFAVHKSGPNMYVRLSLNSRSYNSKSRYNPKWSSYRAMRVVVKYLRDNKYIEIKRGFFNPDEGKGKQTRIRATDKLVSLLEKQHRVTLPMISRDKDEEIIILRNKKKKDIEYDDTPTTKRMRKNLQKINDCLDRHAILLWVKDAELEKIHDKFDRRIDFTQKRLRRVFNKSSWKKGGRFYGGWWQNIPSEYRRYIRINDKDVVECDYSGLHINMLYALEGRDPPEGDVYYIDGYSNDPTFRNFVKRLLLIMVNANDRKEVRAALRKEVNLGDEDGGKLELPKDIPSTKAKDLDPLMDAFGRKHKPIEKYFSSGAGIDLQYRDSLIAEKVMLHFLEKLGCAILPIHDSFIIHHGMEDELKDAMNQAFRDDFSADSRISLKFNGFEDRAKESAGTKYSALYAALGKKWVPDNIYPDYFPPDEQSRLEREYQTYINLLKWHYQYQTDIPPNPRRSPGEIYKETLITPFSKWISKP